MSKYNLLTKRLLAEGYTADNHPDYVRIPTGQTGTGNPLVNIYGGFEYTVKYADERTYETSCGIQCKGASTKTHMYFAGIDFTHENDNPYIVCPKGVWNCLKREEPLTDNTGTGAMWCRCHLSDKEYNPEGSAEQIKKEREARIAAEKKEFIAKHKYACQAHMWYNPQTKKWEFKYELDRCVSGNNCSYGYCPVLRKTFSGAKGNVYYDLHFEGKDYNKEGTFFEGERFHEVIKDLQFFEKPIPLELAEIWAKTQEKATYWRVKYNVMPKYHHSLFLLKAEKGEVDFNWWMENVRAEKRLVRDLDRDLEDIANGIKITHAFDEAKAQKAEKHERRMKAQERRTKAAEKIILKQGLAGIDEFAQKRFDKLLTREQQRRLDQEHKRIEEEKKTAPVQMDIFQFLEEQHANT